MKKQVKDKLFEAFENQGKGLNSREITGGNYYHLIGDEISESTTYIEGTSETDVKADNI